MKTKVKKILSMLFAFTMLFSISAGLDFSAKAAVGDDFCLYYDHTDSSKRNAVITAFEGDIEYLVIPEYTDDGAKVVTIGKDALKHLLSLKVVVIPNTVTLILEGAFANCSNLQYVFLSDNLTRIREYAFANCENLYRVFSNSNEHWPEKLRDINDNAFYNCTNLIDFYAPNVVNIGTAFSGCDSLSSIIFPASLKYLSENFYPASKHAYIGYQGTEEQWRVFGSNGPRNLEFNQSFCSSEDEHQECWRNAGDSFFAYCQKCGVITYELSFKDLKTYGDNYLEYFLYTSAYNEFIRGTNPPLYTQFSPKTPLTRAMFVAILYRMAGNPYDKVNPHKTNPFTDIKPGTYYYNAACWALDEGITNQTTFKPNDNVTREQTARFLFAYAEANDMLGDEAYKNADITTYPDYDDVHSWAVEPLQWANYNNMITGTLQGFINPQGATQRIHATRILYGFGSLCNIGYFE